MAFFKTTFNCFYKRPFLLIYIAVLSLLYSTLQIFNPVVGLLQNLGAIRSESWTDSMIYISKEIYTFSNLAYILPIIALGCLILAVISGAFTSGFMYLYHETLEGIKGKTFELFLIGTRKSIIKISLVFLQFYLLLSAFVLLIPIATVPTIILAQKTIENGSANIFTTDILSILTIVILFLVLTFIVMAFLFRFPSVYYFKNRPVEKSKGVVATAFWRYYAIICILITLLLGNEYMLLGINSKVGEFFVGWFSHTVLLTVVSAVSFTGYNLMLRKFRKE